MAFFPHEITVTWDASPSPVSGYNVYRGTAADNESNVPLNGNTLVTATSYVDGTVFPGVVYFYEVTAVSGGVESEDSLEIKSASVPFNLTPSAIDMGATSSFEILAGSTITNVPGDSVRVAGDIGVWPGNSTATMITGFDAPSSILGSVHSNDFVAESAQASLTAAFNAASAARNPVGLGPVVAGSGPFIVTSVATQTSATTLYTGTFLPGLGGGLVGQQLTIAGFLSPLNNGTFNVLQSTITTVTLDNPNGVAEGAPGTGVTATGVASDGSNPIVLTGDIGGQTLTPGVYRAASSLGITGNLILDAQGNPDATWVFQIGSTLTTASSNSNVILVGGAQASNVFWQVGSSATLGTNTNFAGIVMAQASITANTNANVNGKLLARTGAVTMDGNQVIMFVKATLSVYEANHAYSLGTIVFDCATQTYQQAIVAGTSGANRPSFSIPIGVLTNDNNVVWVSLDPPSVDIYVNLPPSGPNTPPAPPAAPLNPRITSEA